MTISKRVESIPPPQRQKKGGILKVYLGERTDFDVMFCIVTIPSRTALHDSITLLIHDIDPKPQI